MNDDTDEMIELLKPRPSLRAAGGGTSPEELWPRLADPYKASGTPGHHEVSRLVVVMGKDGFKPGATAYHILQYVHIGVGEFGFDAAGDQWFRFLFADRQPKLLTACGRGILRICDYIALRRMPWIRLADRDFRAGDGATDDAPIFTRITVEDWMPAQG